MIARFTPMVGAAILFGFFGFAPLQALAESDDDRIVLQDPEANAPITAQKAPPAHKLALGVSYIGAQVRGYLSQQWAAEFQYQAGTASSNYGDISANVFGLRAYRFFKRRGRMVLYVGPEIAYAMATSNNSNYKTSGFVLGAFGGFDYYLSKRISLGLDLGPYLISLKENQTGLSQTNLDFVLNTTLNWHLL